MIIYMIIIFRHEFVNNQFSHASKDGRRSDNSLACIFLCDKIIQLLIIIQQCIYTMTQQYYTPQWSILILGRNVYKLLIC